MRNEKRAPSKLSSRKLPTKARRETRRAGGKGGDAFRLKLGSLVAEAGSQRAFAKRLREGDASTTDYSPRIGEWLSGKNLPGFENLQRIAVAFNRSVDWLLGFDVAERRTDREPIGSLSSSLMEHIVRYYETHSAKRRRNGLAKVLGGKLMERQSLLHDAKTASDSTLPSPGDVLPDGTIVTNRSAFGLQVLTADPQSFLQSVCEWTFQQAEDWEAGNMESERKLVRADVASLMPLVPKIALAEREVANRDTKEPDIYVGLLQASLNPLDAKSQTAIMLFREHLHIYETREKEWEESKLQITAAVRAESRQLARQARRGATASKRGRR